MSKLARKRALRTAVQALWIALLAAIALSVLPLRFEIVETWHAPAGDGLDYYQLSQELGRAGRFAYGPPPLRESYSRMPGYPLFLSYLAVRAAPLPIDTHLRRATEANVVLDLLTAILLVLILRECQLGLGLFISRGAQVLAFGVALCYPLQVLLSAYGLADSFATFLGMLEIYLAMRAMRAQGRALFVFAALCGVVAGVAQLVRMDAIVVAPAVVAAMLWAKTTLRRRACALAIVGLVAAVVFAPWPLRNLMRFGEAHVSGAYLRLRGDGQPLPGGIIKWARTWATGGPGETYLDLALSVNIPLGWHRLPKEAADSDAERAEVTRIFDLYNREGLSPRVDAEFVKLAEERFRRAPFRTLVTLPLRRLPNLWTPLPEEELPLRIPKLGLPERRELFGRCDRGLYWLTLSASLLLLLRAGGRRLLVIAGLAIVARCVLYCYAVPNAVNQRYVTEAFPLLFLLCAAGFSSPFGSLFSRDRSAEAQRPTRPDSDEIST